MAKPNRSFYLPARLIAFFDREAERAGHVKQMMIAAAMLRFLESNPQERAQMFERLDSFLNGARDR